MPRPQLPTVLSAAADFMISSWVIAPVEEPELSSAAELSAAEDTVPEEPSAELTEEVLPVLEVPPEHAVNCMHARIAATPASKNLFLSAFIVCTCLSLIPFVLYQTEALRLSPFQHQSFNQHEDYVHSYSYRACRRDIRPRGRCSRVSACRRPPCPPRNTPLPARL